ncbi:FAD-binding domain-containing protein [Glonium stellatum]|uniref:FAD-binding domain-containing protein n=1 Tax=Glonium stellatum TaxID=574774 RepID=A0A8E2F8M6_9PEZI|nr:FAD-binding domain-containing protein [Glonium stellatum]
MSDSSCPTLRFSSESREFERLRTRYFNGRVPPTTPAIICCPKSTAEVVAEILVANNRGTKAGVRSGGHLFPCTSLVQDGLLIDTCELNRTIEYNPKTRVVSFGPAVTVKELAHYLTGISRFFPFGHSPSVGAAGFLLAGGQGWFLRGWGCTSDTWITQLEIVTASGKTIIANKEQNSDIFWAAPGSGQGFFAVVTRIWARTIPAKSIFDTTIVLDTTGIFKPLLKYILRKCDELPKYGVDVAISTCYADRDAKGTHDDSNDNRVLINVNCTAYADSAEEANVLLKPLDSISESYKNCMLVRVPTEKRTWADLWKIQDDFAPSGGGERWQCDSILNDPQVPLDQLVDAITPALQDLPSRLTVGFICVADYYPDERDQALSLPQKYYISTMSCWRDPRRDQVMRKWMLDTYSRAGEVSCGQYAADFDATQRMSKIMTDSALTRWLEVREKWDPEEMFVGHRGFSDILRKECIMPKHKL